MSTSLPAPINLSAWIEAHRDQLRPPVGNARIFQDSGEERGFIVMAVAGPNVRRDAFLWLCRGCGDQLHRVELVLTDITTQLAPLFEAFWADEDAQTCGRCGEVFAQA